MEKRAIRVDLSSVGPAEELVRDIRTDGGKAVAIRADVSSGAEVSLLFTKAEEYFEGPVDILVNNREP